MQDFGGRVAASVADVGGPDAKVFDLLSRPPAGLCEPLLITDGRRRS